jgi:PTS system fructose-specific IIC component
MKMSDVLSKDAIALNCKFNCQEEAIDKLVEMHFAVKNISDEKQFKTEILEREAKQSTAVGGGLALPHAQSSVVEKTGLAVVTVPEGVDYNAPDKQPAKLIFMIAASDKRPIHLELLARFVTLLLDAKVVNTLMEAKTEEEFIDIIIEADKKKYPKEASVYEPLEEEELKNILNEKNGTVHRVFKAFKKKMANVRKNKEV